MLAHVVYASLEAANLMMHRTLHFTLGSTHPSVIYEWLSSMPNFIHDERAASIREVVGGESMLQSCSQLGQIPVNSQRLSWRLESPLGHCTLHMWKVDEFWFLRLEICTHVVLLSTLVTRQAGCRSNLSKLGTWWEFLVLGNFTPS